MPRKRVLEALQPQDRAAQRRRLGTLRELTVQPATKRRYTLATQAFFDFLRSEGLSLPKEKRKLDDLVSDYLEHLWSSGKGRGLANDTLAGLQDLQPDLRHHLPGSWRLLKTWAVNEIPSRAPPLPEHIVKAMAGWAFFHGHYTFGISLLIGFYCMLRTGEILELRSSDILMTATDTQAVVSLGYTKGGKRHGAAESVILGYEPAVLLTQQWKRIASSTTKLARSVNHWRTLFHECLVGLKLEAHQFRPYSLRRGGATFWFTKHQSFDRILVQGRWHTQKSARIYLNEGLAMLASMALPPSNPNVKPFIQFFGRTLTSLNFQTLEPPASAGSAGGRGRTQKKRVRGKTTAEA
eukprot:Skav234210  [mRNA]  locus=scaffold2795:127037:128092:- [translate_table: standard]